jgi:hypothetical protein
MCDADKGSQGTMPNDKFHLQSLKTLRTKMFFARPLNSRALHGVHKHRSELGITAVVQSPFERSGTHEFAVGYPISRNEIPFSPGHELKFKLA